MVCYVFVWFFMKGASQSFFLLIISSPFSTFAGLVFSCPFWQPIIKKYIFIICSYLQWKVCMLLQEILCVSTRSLIANLEVIMCHISWKLTDQEENRSYNQQKCDIKPSDQMMCSVFWSVTSIIHKNFLTRNRKKQQHRPKDAVVNS